MMVASMFSTDAALSMLVNKGNSQKLQIDERISQVPVLCIIVVWKADL